MFNWLFHTPPEPVILNLGVLQIRWYGLLLALALVAGVWLSIQLAKQINIPGEKITNLAILATFSAVIGARIFHVLEEWNYYSNHLGDIFKFWQGGLAFHGVVLGGVIALIFWVRSNKYRLLQVLDFAFPALILGQVIGRWGNWFNQELYGKPTNLAWGIPIQAEFRVSGYENFFRFHPLFLYESFGNLLILILLLYLWKKHLKTGTIAATYLILSPLLRFFLDFLRLNQAHLGVLTYAQIFSLILITVGLAILFKIYYLNSRISYERK
ncbi:MAG: prolipoprotein diacylglyceryl transferase [Patescibacteria group bacterium]|jgi:phosphatidylglycerol:prolipoprotein diacylglycerol transferase